MHYHYGFLWQRNDKINEYIQTVTAPTILCISQYDNFQCLERTHLSAKAFHFDPWYIKACLKFENLDDSVLIDKQYVYDRNMLYMFTKHYRNFQGIFNLTPQQYVHLNELMLMIELKHMPRAMTTGLAVSEECFAKHLTAYLTYM